MTLAGAARAQVYTGCAQPSAHFTAVCKATPATLTAIMKAAKPGSHVQLASGDYGSVLIQGFFGRALTAFDNADFVTVEPAPGAAPIIRQLTVKGANKWAFRDNNVVKP